MLAICVGFCGILIVIRPGFVEFQPALLFAFAGMLNYTCFILVTRYLAGHDPPEVTLTFSLLAGTYFVAPFALDTQRGEIRPLRLPRVQPCEIAAAEAAHPGGVGVDQVVQRALQRLEERAAILKPLFVGELRGAGVELPVHPPVVLRHAAAPGLRDHGFQPDR